MLSSLVLVAVTLNYLATGIHAVGLTSESQDDIKYRLQPGAHCKLNYFEHEELLVGEEVKFCFICEEGYENPLPEYLTTCFKIKDTSDEENHKATTSSPIPTTETTLEPIVNSPPQEYSTQGYSGPLHDTTIMVANDTVSETTGISTHTSPVLPYTTVNASESQDGNSSDNTILIVIVTVMLSVILLVVIAIVLYLKKSGKSIKYTASKKSESVESSV